MPSKVQASVARFVSTCLFDHQYSDPLPPDPVDAARKILDDFAKEHLDDHVIMILAESAITEAIHQRIEQIRTALCAPSDTSSNSPPEEPGRLSPSAAQTAPPSGSPGTNP